MKKADFTPSFITVSLQNKIFTKKMRQRAKSSSAHFLTRVCLIFIFFRRYSENGFKNSGEIKGVFKARKVGNVFNGFYTVLKKENGVLDAKISQKEIIEKICQGIQEKRPECFCVITVDRC